jgi:cysteine desulfurase
VIRARSTSDRRADLSVPERNAYPRREVVLFLAWVFIRQPAAEVAEVCRKEKVLFHLDAAQTFGKVPELSSIPYDMASITGHKMYGPKGIGALVVRKPGLLKQLTPQLHGGGQEYGLRAGTLPVPLIVGFGLAAELASKECSARNNKAMAIKASFLKALKRIPHVVNGDQRYCLPHVINVSFKSVLALPRILR